MTIGDLPHISSATASSTSYGLGQHGFQAMTAQNVQQTSFVVNQDANQHWQRESEKLSQVIRAAQAQNRPHGVILPTKEPQMTQRRLVQVFIADPDENVPLEKSLIYSGEQKLTDATNEELFHEIEINRILKEHNEYRATLINKKVKERVEYLEPVRIRDLKMVVVENAKF